jgi:hypothetical protein
VPQTETKITSLGAVAGKVVAVSLLGSNAKLDWSQDPDALVLKPAAEWPCQPGVVFKIELGEP